MAVLVHDDDGRVFVQCLAAEEVRAHRAPGEHQHETQQDQPDPQDQDQTHTEDARTTAVVR